MIPCLVSEISPCDGFCDRAGAEGIGYSRSWTIFFESVIFATFASMPVGSCGVQQPHLIAYVSECLLKNIYNIPFSKHHPFHFCKYDTWHLRGAATSPDSHL